MEINGYQAAIQHDLEIEMFNGEFFGLNGGADSHARFTEVLTRC
jgi:predicted HicB family RNase H-like nuclease